MHAWHMRHVSARAHLAWTVFTGSREAGNGNGGCGSAPERGRHRAAAAGGDGREHRVTCVGRSGQLERARQQDGSPHERIVAVLRWPARLWRRGKRVHKDQGRYGCKASAVRRSSERVSQVRMRWDECTCTAHMQMHRTSVPRLGRLHGPQRGWCWRQRAQERPHGLRPSSRGRWRRPRRRPSDL